MSDAPTRVPFYVYFRTFFSTAFSAFKGTRHLLEENEKLLDDIRKRRRECIQKGIGVPPEIERYRKKMIARGDPDPFEGEPEP